MSTAPVFRKANSTVTDSPASTRLFVGAQLSATSLAESSTTTKLLFTTTVKLFVALSGGAPLSVATVRNTLVVLSCVSVGVQVITPSEEIAALVGPVSSE